MAGLSTLVVPIIAAPSLIVIVHLLIVAPLFTAAAVGIVGYIQLAMGMKENRIISMLVFIMLIAGLTISTSVVQQDAAMVTTIVAALFLLAIFLLGLSFLLSNRLNKEKIVTSIPD
jgi:ABC-2 type transport system permease protein